MLFFLMRSVNWRLAKRVELTVYFLSWVIVHREVRKAY